MSTDALANQVPVNGTIQVKVPPGIQTGWYYITLSNLPWNTTWQQLKDHVRVACPVKRAEVFNNSTTGWVVVHGERNFRAALKLLQGGLFNGRPTFALDKNGTESIYVKKYVPSPRAVPSHRTAVTVGGQQTTSPLSVPYSISDQMVPSPHTDYGQMGSYYETRFEPSQWTTNATTDPWSPDSDYSPYPAPANVSYDCRDPLSWYPYETASGCYADPCFPVTAPVPYVYDLYDSLYAPRPPQFHGDSCGVAQPTASDKPPHRERHDRFGKAVKGTATRPNRFVALEKRKVIVKGLPARTSRQDVHALFRSQAGPDGDADEIVKVHLPAASKQGQGLRGYAIITFRSEEAAARVMRRLDGCRLEGRALRAEYTKEGVSRGEDGRGGGGKQQRGGKRGLGSRKEASATATKTTTGTPFGDKGEKFAGKKCVVIADGTCTRASEGTRTNF